VKIALLPSTVHTDPTYHRVLSSLKREFISSGRGAGIFSLKTDANPGLRIMPETGALFFGGLRARAGKDGHRLLARALAAHLPPGTVLNFHFSGWLRPWHAPVLLAEELSGVRLVITFQDYRHPDLPPLTLAARRVMRGILDRAQRVTAVSRFLARIIGRDFPSVADKLVVIPNGTDIPPAAKASPPPGPDSYIFTVGRSAPYKGLDLLLFGYAQAVEKGCAAGLIVCGTDGRGHLRELAGKLGVGGRVRFEGLVPPGKISKLMRGCLFYATTPRWESFGMAALEAMAAGKAVLAAKTGGLPEFAMNGRNAVLAAPENIKSISSGILRLWSDGKLRETLGRKAAATALNYSWEKIAAEYIKSAYS
jgi:glycosyltransferase involved in cell wall biosynthesis